MNPEVYRTDNTSTNKVYPGNVCAFQYLTINDSNSQYQVINNENDRSS